MTRLARYLGRDGLLDRQWPGFEPRAGQLELAQNIAAAIAERGVLLAEAATGTGKTLAYLLPLLLSKRTALISTGTRNLQEQLYHRDLPAVRELLGSGISCSLLKGRNNYLCLYRQQQARGHPRMRSGGLLRQLALVDQWAQRTATGDLAEIPGLSEEAAIRSWVTSTADNCLGTDCPLYDDCYVYRARAAAHRADIVVVNHHLLFADLALREQGFGEVLPDVDAVIVDEAHQAPAVASQFFGRSISHRQITELLRDAEAEAARQSGVLGVLQPALEQLRQAQREWLLALAPHEQRLPMQQLLDGTGMQGPDGLLAALAELQQQLESLQESSKGLQQIAERLQKLGDTLKLCIEGADGYVCWYEPRQRGYALHATPLAIDDLFSHVRAQGKAAWIFTSATLSVRGDFSYFAGRLGLQEATRLAIESPYDYAANTRLWIPANLPLPGSREHTVALLRAVMPLLKANRGRAFLLFTTHRALRLAARWLREHSDFELQVQGEAPRSELLQAFRRGANSLLLGAASFWEGVDVIGAGLSIVVIDKLPFAAPDDPVYQARSEAISRAGGNPFAELALPEAVLALKQGVGRLIRHELDYGVVVIGDRRLVNRNYGRQFLHSLPVTEQCRDAGEAAAFLAARADGHRMAGCSR